MLVVKELTVGYRQRRVVHSACLTVEEGELVYIFGPSNSGKSTLLKGIAGRAKVFSGEKRFRGNSLIGLGPEKMAGIGLILIPQKGGYFEGLKVSEHFKLAVGLETPPEEVRRLMEGLSAGFEPEMKVKKLGLLERRLLALFVVLSLKPKLVMYDEPFDGLDDARDMAKAILAAHKMFNQTFLIASRLNPKDLGIKPDRLYFMKAGFLTASPSSNSF